MVSWDVYQDGIPSAEFRMSVGGRFMDLPETVCFRWDVHAIVWGVSTMVTPIRVLDPEKTILLIVGVSGTSGYVLQQVARLLYALKEQGQKIPSVLAP